MKKSLPMRISDLRFLLALALPFSAVVGVLMAPQLSALITLLFWAIIVLLDLFLPGGKQSPAALIKGVNLAYFSWILRGFVLLQLALIGLGAYAAVQGDWLTTLGLAFSVGFITGAQGITFAHELGHSKSKIDRFCAWVLMTSVCYGHFMVEHYRGHHPRAATYDDPASARYGESLYRFLPRTLWGSLVSGWRLEGQRIEQMKSSWVRSPLLWSAVGSLMFILLPALYFNAQAAMKYVVFFVGQSCVAFLLLEMVNYIEHYGLQRNTDGGKREAFGMMHAWNADHLVTNSLLANLQRHSDHHMHAWKPYATLDALPDPQLPTGYAGCLMLAMVPPLWFSLMHKRISALRGGNTAMQPTGSSV
jgi:alkane 1-monooxygenase